jgi:hypothetical protein
VKFRGRNGRTYKRDIFKDIETFKEYRIQIVICLLNDYELRSLGIKPKEYLAAAAKLEVEVL